MLITHLAVNQEVNGSITKQTYHPKAKKDVERHDKNLEFYILLFEYFRAFEAQVTKIVH